MSKFKYTEYVPHCELIVEIDNVLRAAGIPSVLLDDCLLSTYGVPFYPAIINIVIPDQQMDAAVQVLKDVGFPDDSNKDYSRCRWNDPDKGERTSSIEWPDRWFHLYPLPPTPESPKYRDHYDLCLHRKSVTLWTLPDFSLEDPAPDDPNFMLATDPRLPEGKRAGFGRGRFTVPGCRVQIPTPARYTESLFLIIAREYNMLDRGFYWVRNLSDMKENVYKYTMDREFLEPDKLDPLIRRVWKGFLNDSVGVVEYESKYLVPFRNKLIKRGELPDPAFPWAKTWEEVSIPLRERFLECVNAPIGITMELPWARTNDADPDATGTDAADP